MGWIKTSSMKFLSSWNLLHQSVLSYDTLPLNFGRSVSTPLQFPVPSSLREGVCTFPMHNYWHAVMDTFVAELVGSRGFSLIPPKGLGMVVSVNPRLLLPSKSVVAYARKQSRSAILEWDVKKKGWFWHAGDYPPSWEKKVKVINISVPSKKAPAKPKSASKTKPATPLPPAGAPLASRTCGSKRKTTPHPVSAAERRVSYFSLFFFFFDKTP